MNYPSCIRIVLIFALALQVVCVSIASAAPGRPELLLRQLDESVHVRQIAFSSEEVVDHEIGLGAVQKVRGEWRFKRSERLSGTLLSYTWQVGNGYSAAEVMAQLLDSVAQIDGATSLFSCDGRACGRAVQWANGVFEERVLYGREDNQQYRVIAFEGERAARLIAYSAERTADRQYLHVELLLTAPE
jgi:hypothetical protein